jgi:hypothetical protein
MKHFNNQRPIKKPKTKDFLTHATRFCSAADFELSIAFLPVIISRRTTPKL